MAAQPEGGRGLIKGYILVMFMLAIGAGGTAWYLHAGSENSVSLNKLRLAESLQAAEDVRGYLSPSLREYFDLQSQGKIASVDRGSAAETERLMNDLVVNAGIPIGTFKVTSQPPRAAARGAAAENERWVVKIELGVAGAGGGSSGGGVTRAQWQRVLQDAREKFGSFAVCESLKVVSVLSGQRLNQQLSGAIDERNFLYRVDFEYVWYMPSRSPAISAPSPRAR